MRSKPGEIPRWIEPGSPFRIESETAPASDLHGVFYCADLRAMMRKLREMQVEFWIGGSPSKGIRDIHGNGFQILCPKKAWLLDNADQMELDAGILEIHDVLGQKFRPTAAKSFTIMAGRMPWIAENIRPFARAAFSGGVQWSNPGVFPYVTTSDMRSAYYWAMHKMMLPKQWTVTYNPRAQVTMMSMVHATVTTNGRNPLPILPSAQTFTRHTLVGMHGRQTLTGHWFGPDFIMALPYLENCIVHAVAYASPTRILQRRIDIDEYPHGVRKRLALVGYGIHAQAEKSSVGVFEEHFYDACTRFKTHKIRVTDASGEDGMSVWWNTTKEPRPYVRIDWAGMVTSRVRYRLIAESHAIMAAGGDVCRLYVDSITATLPVQGGYGGNPGEFKIENQGPAIIGPPGICWLGGTLKHSGVPIARAAKIIESVRDGTYKLNNADQDWSGLSEELV